ncbi:hypothetical protein HWQ67_19470, partial [Candidatus Magnetobacterium casensis]
MSVTVETVYNSYGGSGTTGPFAYGFKIFDDDDLTVILRDTADAETTLVKDLDYTVYEAGEDDGGYITTAVAIAAGYTIVLIRTADYLRMTNYASLQDFSASAINNELDKIEHQVQQLYERTRRAVLFKATSNKRDMNLPDPVANYMIGWDSSGTAMQNYPTTAMTIPTIDWLGNYANSFSAAITAIGAGYVHLAVTDAVTVAGEDIDVPDNIVIWVLCGTMLTVNAGASWKADRISVDGIFHWIDAASAGTIDLSTSNLPYIYPEYYGAKMDGSTDDSAELLLALG